MKTRVIQNHPDELPNGDAAVVANDVTTPGAGFGSDQNAVRLLDESPTAH